MNRRVKLAQIENSLELVAEQIGDLTPLILHRYYKRFPNAKNLFLELGGDQSSDLELSMVESVIYCLMVWYERPEEIKITLAGTVPHHQFLKIPTEMFVGLVEVAVQVITSPLKRKHKHFLPVWNDVETELMQLIEASKIR